jgi:hypothetical protein
LGERPEAVLPAADGHNDIALLVVRIAPDKQQVPRITRTTFEQA